MRDLVAESDRDSIDTVIYHGNCSDGTTAALIASEYLVDCDLIPANYNNDSVLDEEIDGKSVLIVDFSYDRDTLQSMNDSARSLVVLDHHVTAEKSLAGLPYCKFDMTKSGAMMAWEYFHPNEKPPRLVSYVQDADLWQWRLPGSRQFFASLSCVDREVEEYRKLLNDRNVDAFIKQGASILKSTDANVKSICSHAGTMSICGYCAAVVNSATFQSEIGNELAKSAQLAVVWYYHHRDRQTRISLRSVDDDVDVSTIAEKFGGGGHRHAAGIVLDEKVGIDSIRD